MRGIARKCKMSRDAYETIVSCLHVREFASNPLYLSFAVAFGLSLYLSSSSRAPHGSPSVSSASFSSLSHFLLSFLHFSDVSSDLLILLPLPIPSGSLSPSLYPYLSLPLPPSPSLSSTHMHIFVVIVQHTLSISHTHFLFLRPFCSLFSILSFFCFILFLFSVPFLPFLSFFFFFFVIICSLSSPAF